MVNHRASKTLQVNKNDFDLWEKYSNFATQLSLRQLYNCKNTKV
jgi:hypothetical protein